jgi:hypothetical protein
MPLTIRELRKLYPYKSMNQSYHLKLQEADGSILHLLVLEAADGSNQQLQWQYRQHNTDVEPTYKEWQSGMNDAFELLLAESNTLKPEYEAGTLMTEFDLARLSSKIGAGKLNALCGKFKYARAITGARRNQVKADLVWLVEYLLDKHVTEDEFVGYSDLFGDFFFDDADYRTAALSWVTTVELIKQKRKVRFS